MRRLRPGACLAVGLALLAVACTGDPAPTPHVPTPVAADAPTDIAPLPRDRIRDGGLLRFPLAELPSQWNPRHPDAAAARTALAPLTPAHVTLDAAGRPRPNPDFITEAVADHSGPTVVTLHLNPKAVWGDGSPLTAADWVATWRAATGAVPGITLANAEGWDRVAEVRAGDTPTQVLLTYRGVDPDWAEPLVWGPVRETALAGPAAFSWSKPTVDGLAGPFTVAHVDSVQGLVTLTRNPRWWGDAPKLERILLRTVPAEALAAAFQHNELDVWETGISTDRLQQTRAAADTTLRTAPGTKGRVLLMNPDGVLADTRVRTALLLALDRAAVAGASVPDSSRAPRTWSNPLLLPTQPGYSDQARATGLGHDPARSAQLLQEAGWVASGSIRHAEGVPLELTFERPEADPQAAAEFEAVSAQLEPLGIRLTPVTSDADLTPRNVSVSAFPLAHLPERSLASPGLFPQASRIAHEVDAVRRADQASQLARLLWRDVAEVPLYQVPQFVAVRDGLANYGAPGYATTDWEDVGWSA